MTEEVLFAFERSMSREEVATYLRTVADRLEGDDELTLEANGEELTLSPPARPEFEVKAERETSSSGGPAELSVEFELEWREDQDDGAGDGDLTIR